MFNLDVDIKKGNITEPIEGTFEPAYNLSRLASYNGYLVFTSTKMYWFYNDGIHNVKALKLNPWCVDYSEIASYRKTGLAGYRISLKDGNDINFSNVFRKMRNGITEILQKHV